MGVERFAGSAGVLSDGRFAVFGGRKADDASGNFGDCTASCEVLTFFDGGERWDSLPPMRQPRSGHACAVVGSCVIVAGGEHWQQTMDGGFRGSARTDGGGGSRARSPNLSFVTPAARWCDEASNATWLYVYCAYFCVQRRAAWKKPPGAARAKSIVYGKKKKRTPLKERRLTTVVRKGYIKKKKMLVG